MTPMPPGMGRNPASSRNSQRGRCGHKDAHRQADLDDQSGEPVEGPRRHRRAGGAGRGAGRSGCSRRCGPPPTAPPDWRPSSSRSMPAKAEARARKATISSPTCTTELQSPGAPVAPSVRLRALDGLRWTRWPGRWSRRSAPHRPGVAGRWDRLSLDGVLEGGMLGSPNLAPNAPPRKVDVVSFGTRSGSKVPIARPGPRRRVVVESNIVTRHVIQVDGFEEARPTRKDASIMKALMDHGPGRTAARYSTPSP